MFKSIRSAGGQIASGKSLFQLYCLQKRREINLKTRIGVALKSARTIGTRPLVSAANYRKICKLRTTDIPGSDSPREDHRGDLECGAEPAGDHISVGGRVFFDLCRGDER
jgi:hypothetical protein